MNYFLASVLIILSVSVDLSYEGAVGAALAGEEILDKLKDRWNFGCVKDDAFGCSKGYCWSNCAGFGQMTVTSLFTHDWCYTTRGRSQDYNYVRCESKSDCDPCWKCAGSCTV